MLTKRFFPPLSVLVPVVALLAVALWYASRRELVYASLSFGFALGVLLRRRARRALDLGVD